VRWAGCFFGLFPIFAVTGVVFFSARLAQRVFGKRWAGLAFFGEINRVSLEMINASAALRMRCVFSGSLFQTSPRVAGAVYRYFNVCLFGVLWALLLCALAAAA